MRGVETMDNQEKMKYIYAFTFGDGCLEKTKGDNENSRLRIEHVWRNLDYLEWKQSILNQITSTSLNRKVREGREDTGLLLTSRHPVYTKCRERMYLNGVKVLDPHFESFLDWETMAVIYQDDGYLGKNGDYIHSINLCTENLSYGDQLLLRNWCASKLNMHFNIIHHKASYRMRLGKKFLEEFIAGVRPHIVPSMKYKIGESECQAPERDGEIVRSS
jgi:hypothetical protein